MLSKNDIAKLQDLPIESVASRLGLQVNRHKSLCPFHEDSHPSLTFSVSRNRYKCFVCDAHGGVIDLAMHVLGRNFLDTCHWLADSSNIIIEEWKPAQKPVPERGEGFNAQKYMRYFERPFINQLARDFLFEKRHLHPEVVKWCRLTSWKEWLQMPYFDVDGHLTGVQWRYLGTDKSQPRFRFPYGSQCHIYNQPVLKMLRPNEPLYIAEGCSDCWSLLSAGHKAIAIPSATLLNKEDLHLLSTLHAQLSTEFHMYPDQDVPGERLFLHLQSMLEAQFPSLQGRAGERLLVRHSLPTCCKDYSDLYLLNVKC